MHNVARRTILLGAAALPATTIRALAFPQSAAIDPSLIVALRAAVAKVEHAYGLVADAEQAVADWLKANPEPHSDDAAPTPFSIRKAQWLQAQYAAMRKARLGPARRAVTAAKDEHRAACSAVAEAPVATMAALIEKARLAIESDDDACEIHEALAHDLIALVS